MSLHVYGIDPSTGKQYQYTPHTSNSGDVGTLLGTIKAIKKKYEDLSKHSKVDARNLCEVNSTINHTIIDLEKEVKVLGERMDIITMQLDELLTKSSQDSAYVPNTLPPPLGMNIGQSVGVSSYPITTMSTTYATTGGMPQCQLRDQQWNMSLINAKGAWEMGYSGKDVHIMIVDSGVDSRHPDLGKNFVQEYSLPASNGWIPTSMAESHGTSCASLACGTGNKYVTGVAYDAKLSAVYAIGSGDIVPTATALVHHMDKIDIYSNSWGSNVQYMGIGVSRKGYFTADVNAIQQGAALGRPYRLTNGSIDTTRKPRGCIYVFASGNDGMNLDMATWQEILNTPYTIAVGAVNHRGTLTKYSTPGTSILVAGPGGNDPYAATPEPGCPAAMPCIGNSMKYTTSFNGTSAATPHVSGIVALMLQANPDLTWRDVQHILTYGSQHPNGIKSASVSSITELYYSMYYGYGVPNAYICCALAKDWVPLPEMIEAKVVRTDYDELIPTDPKGKDYLTKELDVGTTYMDTSIERVILSLAIESVHEPNCDIAMVAGGYSLTETLDSRQIDVSVVLESPCGTKHEIVRPVDINDIQYIDMRYSYVSGVPVTENTYNFDIDMKCEGFRDELFCQDVNGKVSPWKIHLLDKFHKYQHRLKGIELVVQGYRMSKPFIAKQVKMLSSIPDTHFLARTRGIVGDYIH